MLTDLIARVQLFRLRLHRYIPGTGIGMKCQVSDSNRAVIAQSKEISHGPHFSPGSVPVGPVIVLGRCPAQSWLVPAPGLQSWLGPGPVLIGLYPVLVRSWFGHVRSRSVLVRSGPAWPVLVGPAGPVRSCSWPGPDSALARSWSGPARPGWSLRPSPRSGPGPVLVRSRFGPGRRSVLVGHGMVLVGPGWPRSVLFSPYGPVALRGPVLASSWPSPGSVLARPLRSLRS